MRLQRRTAAIAAAALTATTLVAAPAAAGNPNSSAKLARAVSGERVMGHLAAFQKIADTHGDRAAGTPGYEASGAYVEKTLRAAGYTTKRQYFDFVYEHVNATSLTEVSPTARTFAHNPMTYSPATPPGGVTASLVSPANFGCDAADWAGVSAAGRIALISRGTCPFAQKATAAKTAGAAAAIIYNNADGALNGTLGAPGDAYAPVTGITKADGEALKAEMARGPVTMTFVLDKVVETRKTFNVLAETATGRADNVVMVGAHLDSVHDGPGINDNGSGSAAILETAVQLGSVNKVNNKVRFAWWGAEEIGLLGSTHYVNDLVKNNPAELKNIAGYLNFDMVGSPNHIIGVYDANQSTYQAPVAVPEGSAALEKVFTDHFDATGQPWVDTEFSGRSDYQAFIVNGVPASGLFTGADGKKTAKEVAMFGGTEGILYDPNYHTPKDDLSNINRAAIDINIKAMGAAVGTLAYDTSMVNGKESRGKSGKPKKVTPQTEESVR
ncbi:M20/M25/M40 family metallo-hydrolase [Mariniluteicoccus flavus]